MININTSMFPYRMNIASKEPVEFTIIVKNVSDKTKLLSLDIILEQSLSFDKSGLKKSSSHRIGEIGPGQTFKRMYTIHPFQGIQPGTHNVIMKVSEHYNNYNQLTDRTEKIAKINAI